MAQKTEKEETEVKVPETMTLCVNNCGVIGNPATNNMCQKCFTASTTPTTPTSESTITSSSSASSSSPNSESGITAPIQFSAERSFRSRRLRSPERDKESFSLTRHRATTDLPEDLTQTEAIRSVNRCSGCRRKVGLTGFRCRCGGLYCSAHRYSDRHDCTFDYKAAGREAIARENPVVKAAKIVRV